MSVFGKQEINYLAKLSSEPGARGATAEGESENTSTSSPPEEGGGPAGAGGTAPRPRRSADGEGVDWKTGKKRVSVEPSGHAEASWAVPRPPTAATGLWGAAGAGCGRFWNATAPDLGLRPSHGADGPTSHHRSAPFPTKSGVRTTGKCPERDPCNVCSEQQARAHCPLERGRPVPRPPLLLLSQGDGQSNAHRTNL